MPGRLAGEIAIVTGSTAGLGVEIARLFLEEGASVVVTGRDADRGAAVAADLGGASRFVPADLTRAGDHEALVAATVEAFGGVSVVVNNAVSPGAIAADGPLLDVPDWVWDEMYRTSVVGAARLCQAALPVMLEAGRGAIVNVSSRAAERGTPGLTAYGSAKAGLNALARAITVDYGRRGIRANTVQPGYILHETRSAGLDDAGLERFRAMHVTRLATARDVAWSVVFLASRESECISGVTLRVDGGSTAVRASQVG